MNARTRALTSIAALVALACGGPRPKGIVRVRTPAGEEQGVATPYGILFLGRTAQAGRCDVTVFFGDGPSIEPGTIEAADSEICVALLEVKVPMSEVSFTYPDPSDAILIAIAHDDGPEYFTTEVSTEAGVEGTVLRVPRGFPVDPTVVGAGVYRFEDGRYRLIGLVNGVARYRGLDGQYHEVLTFLGPRNLTVAVLKDKDRGRPKDPPLRSDILK